MRSPYWVNEVYSLGYWLKDYAFYPKKWPLFSYMDHGMTLNDSIPPHEINNDAALIFKFSPRLVDKYKRTSNKDVYNIVNPYIYYRRKYKICQNINHIGTIFFVAHSTQEIDDLTDWEEYIDKLKQIPYKYHPIDICLHPTDVEKGLNKIFERHGYKVFCAGSPVSIEYAANFYAILKRYSFCMSNLLGSYLYYAVELGIPFSLYGEEPKYFNKTDGNIEKGEYTSYRGVNYVMAKQLFTGFFNEITDEQKDFVLIELGVKSTVSRWEACVLVYKALFQYALKKSKRFIRNYILAKDGFIGKCL